NGTTLPAAPGPQDVHPTAYASVVVPPNALGMGVGVGVGGPPLLLQPAGQRPGPGAVVPPLPPPPGSAGAGAPPPLRTDSRAPRPSSPEISLPPPPTGPGALSGGSGLPPGVGVLRGSPPFRGGPPPPVVLDESRHPSGAHPHQSLHTPLAPMD